MRILGTRSALKNIGLFGYISCAERCRNVFSRTLLRFGGNSNRIRTHIRNQTNAALGADINALIELLSAKHGSLRRH